jgi:hypothetical protein
VTRRAQTITITHAIIGGDVNPGCPLVDASATAVSGYIDGGAGMRQFGGPVAGDDLVRLPASAR